MKALLITTSHIVEQIEVDGSLKAIQNAVGGMIEALQMTPEVHAYIDEEGKLKEKEPNVLATMLCKKLQVGLMTGDIIVGDMILFGSLDENGETDGKEHDYPTNPLICGFSKVVDDIICQAF